MVVTVTTVTTQFAAYIWCLKEQAAETGRRRQFSLCMQITCKSCVPFLKHCWGVQRRTGELPAVLVTSVAGMCRLLSAHINLICYRKVICPPVERTDWHVIESSFSGLEMLASGQVSLPVSINMIINSVSRLWYPLCCSLSHTVTLTAIVVCDRQQCRLVVYS